MKRIVIYYSLEGNTKKAAQIISKELGADMMRLRPIKDNPKKGFSKFAIGGFAALSGTTPQLRPFKADLGKYDEIILGFPVWAGKPAPAINTLITEYNVADRISYIFTCSGSGNNKSCMKSLKKRLFHISHTVSLYDSNSDASSENDARIKAFIDEIKK